MVSSILTYVTLVASAFSTKIYHIFLFQGVFLGIAQGLALPLYVSLPSQWFYRRRATATGFAVSGSGLGSGVFSIIARKL